MASSAEAASREKSSAMEPCLPTTDGRIITIGFEESIQPIRWIGSIPRQTKFEGEFPHLYGAPLINVLPWCWLELW
jgi:hypothetical protein